MRIGFLLEDEIEKALSTELRDKVIGGQAHWVTVKEGPLEGRHLLIDGPKPRDNKGSRGKVLAGHGVPNHVIEKLGVHQASDVRHTQADKDQSTGNPIGEHPYRMGHTVTYQRPGSSKKLTGKVEGVSGDTLTVNVKGSSVKVPVSHVVGAEKESNKTVTTKKPVNPFNVEPEGGWTEADRVPEHLQKPSDAAKHILHGDDGAKPDELSQHRAKREAETAKYREAFKYGLPDVKQRLNELQSILQLHNASLTPIQQEKVSDIEQSIRDAENLISGRTSANDEQVKKIRYAFDGGAVKLQSMIRDIEKRAKEHRSAEPEQVGVTFPLKEESSKPSGPFTGRDASRYNNTSHWTLTADEMNRRHMSAIEQDRKSAIAMLQRHGVSDVPTDVQEALKRLADAREHYTRENIRSRETAPPVSVVGPANYHKHARPERAEKIDRNAIEVVQKAKQRLERVIDRYSPKRAVSSDESDAVQQLQSKIDEAQKIQEKYKQINLVIRKKKLTDEQKVEEMMKLGIGEKLARQAVEPDYMGRQGIPSYMLQNNLANIKRMQGRVEELSRKRSDTATSHEFDGGVIHDNVDGNRVQIFFDGKPDADVRQKMKSRGFHWSPTAEGPNGEKGAWQRMRSPEAMRLAREFTGANGEVQKSMSDKLTAKEKAKKKYMNADGTFKGGFDGAVKYFMHVEGYDEETAKKVAGKIAAEKMHKSLHVMFAIAE